MWEAGMQCHSASYPISAKSPRTLSSPLPSNAETFYRITYRGRSSPVRRAISDQRPERSPSMPAPFPATLMSWQGNPPVITSTVIPSCLSLSPVNSLTSVYCGTSGQCLASTLRGYASISQKATVLKPPVRSSPSENPPMPENKSSTCSVKPLTPQASTAQPGHR